MKLQQAFEIVQGDVVSFIGAGGKTSLMVGLAYELAEAGWRVLATSTVSFDQHQLDLVPRAMPFTAGPDAISDALTQDRFVFLYRGIRKGKVIGIPRAGVPTLLDNVDSDVILVEADISNGLPLKAPYEGEPVIPHGTSLVIPVASMAAVGQPLDEEHVYNAAAMIERYGFAEGTNIKSPWIAQVLRDEMLGLHGIPAGARVMAYLNQTGQRGRARVIARMALRSSRINGIVLGSVRAAEPVLEIQRPIGAVVLAAGLSTRMGEPKVLLEWSNGRTIIEHILEQLFKSRLDHINVVTGHQAREVKQLLKPLDVNLVHNRAYKSGEMLSSIQAGLSAMPENVAAALIVLGDQPAIQPKVIYQVASAYAEGKGDLIVPSYQKRRGHPVLIGRRYWPEILALPHTATLRDVMNQHNDRITYVNVDTDSILRDVDTPQDYNEERRQSGL